MPEQSPSPAQMYEQSFVPAIFVPWTQVLLAKAKPRPGEHVLDLACGTGIVARTVASMVGTEGRVTGVDVSDDMLGVAREIAERERLEIDWRAADASEVPVGDGAVDLVTCQQGVQFFSNSPAAAAEMHRVLRDGGRAVVSVWQGLDLHPVYQALLEAEADYLDEPVADVATPFFYGDAERLQGELQQAGFDRVEITEEVHEVRFGDPDRFVAMTVMAGAAVLPEFAAATDAERYALIEEISSRADATVQRYRSDGHIAFLMHANVAVAWK